MDYAQVKDSATEAGKYQVVVTSPAGAATALPLNFGSQARAASVARSINDNYALDLAEVQA